MAIGNTVEAVIGASLSPTFVSAFTNAEKTVKGLGATVDQLSSKATAAKGINDLRGSVERASTSLKNAEGRLAAINTRIQAGEEQTDALVEAWIRAEERVERGRDALAHLERKLESSSRQAKQFGATTDALAASQAAIQAQLERTTRIQERYNRVVARSNDLQEKAGKLGMAAAGTAAAGYGMARVLQAPISVGMDTEAGLSRVMSIANTKGVNSKTGKEFATLEEAQAALTDRIKQLGASTAYSSAQVAESAKYLTQAGFDIGKTIDALPATLSLASAGDLGLGETADILSNIMQPFQIGADKTTDVADVMSKVITTSNTNIQQLGEAMKYVAPVAFSLGLSLEETAASVGVLSNAGIQASMAGTSLRSMMSRLLDPAGEAKKAIDLLGVSTIDSAGNMRNPLLILQEMGEAMDNLGYGTGEKGQAIAKIFGQEAASGALTMMDALKKKGMNNDALSKYIADVRAASGSGLVNQIAAKQLDNLKGDMANMTSAVEGMYETMYDAAKPFLRTVVKGFTEVVGGINSWMQANPMLTKGLMTVALVLTAVTIGAAALLGVMSVATFATSLWVRANAALGLVMGATGGSLGVMNVATFAYNTLATATVTRLKAVSAWYTVTNARLVTQIPLVWASVTAWRAKTLTMAAAGGAASRLGTAIMGMGTTLKGWAITGATAATGLASSVGAGMAVVAKAALTPIASIKALGTALWGLVASNPLGWIIGAVVAVAFLIYKYWEPIKAFAGGVWQALTEAFVPIKEALAPLQPIFDGIGAGLGYLKDMFVSLLSPVAASNETLTMMGGIGYALGKVLAMLLKPIEWVAKGLGLVGEAWNAIFGEDEEKTVNLNPVAKSPLLPENNPMLQTANGAYYTKSGNVLMPDFGAGRLGSTAAPMAPLVASNAEDAEAMSPYAAMTRDRALAATGTSGAAYSYRTQTIDKVEIQVAGGANPHDTADAIMRRFEAEAARREREMND